MNIYQNTYRFKVAIIISALCIALISIAYTNYLVGQLSEREQKQIDLYAKAQAAVVKPSDKGSLNFLMTEILEANTSIPVILVDKEGSISGYRNIEIPENLGTKEIEELLSWHLQEMKEEHEPIPIEIEKGWTLYVYYENSVLITRLQYFPYVQLPLIAILGLLTYLIFSTSRKSEQNRVWAGWAKETAHQLGTPISGLMAWVEYFREIPTLDSEIVDELEKDVNRLNTIAARFSNIGSKPVLKQENIPEVIEDAIFYLKRRLSSKVNITIKKKSSGVIHAPLNIFLFEWVVENLCKNAVDAMAGRGEIEILIGLTHDKHNILIEFTDTGKGIPSSKMKTVFNPGYTTKKRGWGLGLALTKRIIENYHKGKIFVAKSKINVGTTFHIIIPKHDSK